MGDELVDYSGNAPLMKLPFRTIGGFNEWPIMVGWSKAGELSFASNMDGYTLESFEVPSLAELEPKKLTGSVRTYGDRRLIPEAEVAHCFCDDKRGLALLIADQTLVAARLDKKAWEAEKQKKKPSPEIPSQLRVGEPMRIPLRSRDVVVEVVRNLPWGDEPQSHKQQHLGYVSSKELITSPLRLERAVTAEDDSITLPEANSSISSGQLIRIDRELMTVTKVESEKLHVTRSRPVAHPQLVVIELLDKQGRASTELKINQNRDEGKATWDLFLDADLSEFQNTIYVYSARAMEGRKLPQKIRVGNEVMSVVEVDTFEKKLTVERDSPRRHRVTEPILFVEEESAEEKASHELHLPQVKEDELLWTPSPSQVGRNLIRLRFIHKGVCWEELKEINVNEK